MAEQESSGRPQAPWPLSEARQRFDRVMTMYGHRHRLFYLVTQIPDVRLEMLRSALDKLTAEDLDAVESYVIGLAAWRDMAQESKDGG